MMIICSEGRYIQFQKFKKLAEFGLTEGDIFNFENFKLSLIQKW